MSSDDDIAAIRSIGQHSESGSVARLTDGDTVSTLLPSLDFISPIGKLKKRQPGPITSTPRTDGAAIRPERKFSDNSPDRLSLISEDTSSLTDGDDRSLVTASSDSDKSKRCDVRGPAFDRKVDRSRSILSPVGSTSLLERRNDPRASMLRELHEKRKAAWGYGGQSGNNALGNIVQEKDDKAPPSPMQVSTTSSVSLMEISKRSSISDDKVMSFKDDKKISPRSNDMRSTTNVAETEKINGILVNRGSSSMASSKKDDVDNPKNFSIEMEDVISSINADEDSIHISTANLSTEISDSVEECKSPMTAEKIDEVTTKSVLDDSDSDDIQIIESISPQPSISEAEPSQMTAGAFARRELEAQLANLKSLKRSADLTKLPDGGKRLLEQIRKLREKLKDLSASEKAENMPPNVQPAEKENGAVLTQKQKGPSIIPPHPIVGERRLFGGKMTDERICMANAVTGQVIAQMHSSLANAPENVKTITPAGLRTELMPHQQEGLTWLLWREKQSSPGGILADDMGLGKTLSMLSLIVYAKEQRKLNAGQADDWKRKAIKDSSLIPSKATLIVAPASLIFQWEAEIKKHVKSDRLSRYMFHGPKYKRDVSPRCLAQFDIVITTYGIVSSELAEKFTVANAENECMSSDTDDSNEDGKGIGRLKRKVSKQSNSLLTKIAWERVILDEAHQIRNKTSLVSKACCKIPGAARWCLTGTPIHNNLWDLYSLIRFLRVVPFSEEAVWKEYILSGRMFYDAYALDFRPLVNLKPKMSERIDLKLEGLEKKVYDYMFQVSRQQVKELIKTREERERELYGIGRNRRTKANDEPMRNPFLGGPRTIRNNDNFQAMSCVLTLLMRLRQACVHLALINKAVDMEAFETLGIDDNDENAQMLSNFLANMSLMDENVLTANLLSDGTKNQAEQLFQMTFLSTKIKNLLERVDRAICCGDKCVIVSQWTSLLDIVEFHLRRKKIPYTSITGKVLASDRQNRANSFNELESGPLVMLLSLTAGGVGLNLIGGNHLFLVDLHWNPALEQQACDRIYRMGQSKSVFIHKLVCLETIEERVLSLQQSKQALAKGVLEGAASKKLNKLTVADLKYLFDLGRPRNELANAYQPLGFVRASTIANNRIEASAAGNSEQQETKNTN